MITNVTTTLPSNHTCATLAPSCGDSFTCLVRTTTLTCTGAHVRISSFLGEKCEEWTVVVVGSPLLTELPQDQGRAPDQWVVTRPARTRPWSNPTYLDESPERWNWRKTSADDRCEPSADDTCWPSADEQTAANHPQTSKPLRTIRRRPLWAIRTQPLCATVAKVVGSFYAHWPTADQGRAADPKVLLQPAQTPITPTLRRWPPGRRIVIYRWPRAIRRRPAWHTFEKGQDCVLTTSAFWNTVEKGQACVHH